MAQEDYHIEIDGIKGESTDDKYKGQIAISNFSWGVTQTGTGGSGGGSGAGKAHFNDVHFSKTVDKASPVLMLACATGQHLKKAVVHVRKAGGDQYEYMTVTLTDVLISSYQSGGHAGGDSRPLDQIGLNFAKVEVSYKEQKPDGSLASEAKAGYDLKLNKKV